MKEEKKAKEVWNKLFAIRKGDIVRKKNGRKDYIVALLRREAYILRDVKYRNPMKKFLGSYRVREVCAIKDLILRKRGDGYFNVSDIPKT